MPEEQISALAGDIYDAAINPALWPNALEKICGVVGGRMASIVWQDAAKATRKVFEWGNDPRYRQLYQARYAELDPLFPAACFFPAGHVFRQSDVVAFDELRKTPIYKEWMQPQGYIDFVACYLEKSATSCVVTTVARHERDGIVDEASLSRMRLIVPHIRRAALIGNMVDVRSCQATSLADALNRLSAAVFLVDKMGRIEHLNISGQALLDERTVMHSVGGRLAANAPESDQMLRYIFSVLDDGDMEASNDFTVSLEAPVGARYVAHVLPLGSGARRRTESGHCAVAAVFVHKATVENFSPSGAFGKAYHLTAMELRVLLGIVQVGGGTKVAQELGISESTMRTHLKHVFQKTGTNRQADLVKLVAAFENPMLNAAFADVR